MKRFLIYILVSLILTSQLSFGQNTNVTARNYNLDDGLSHSLITSIAEDNLGFMWFATEDGLNKFDGYEFKIYYAGNDNKTLLENLITKIYVDYFDQVWIYYRGGSISRFDPIREIFYNYKANENRSFSSNNFENTKHFGVQLFFEDSDHNIWIATNSGLNKFQRDSNTFKWFLHDQNNKNSLSNNVITFITEDYEGYLWVGTNNGLNRLNRHTDSIKRFMPNEYDSNTINDTTITYIQTAPDSSLWIGTLHGGLNIIEYPNSTHKKVTHLLNTSLNKNYDQSIGTIFRTKIGVFYVTSVDGLHSIKKINGEFDDRTIIKNKNLVTFNFVEDSKGYVWFTEDGELSLMRINTTTEYLEKINITKEYSSDSNKDKTTLFISKSEILWVASEKGGVDMIDLNAKHFNIIDDNTDQIIHTSNKETYSIYEDTNKNLYVGTKTDLNIINLKDGTLKQFNAKTKHLNNKSYKYSNKPNAILFGAIKETFDNKIWLGSYDNKISLYNPKKQNFLNFHQNINDNSSYKTWSNRTICITKDKQVYFGGTNGGLSKLNDNGVSFLHYPVVENGAHNGTNDSWINIIEEDIHGLLWIGTLRGGLNTYDPRTKLFNHYSSSTSDQTTISSNYVTCILEPKIYRNNTMWIGTMGGLNKFNKKTKTFKQYTTRDGMPVNSIHGILEDNTGKLWISTNKGLVLFDPITEKIRIYTTEDGLPGNEFNGGAYFKNNKGRMYFGGTNGIVYFNPEDIKDNSFIGELVFTNFMLFNETITANDTLDGDIILNKSISYTNKIVLNHKQNIISFKFAALNYKSPKKLKYRYILEGFEENWNEVDANQRIAHYTNIPSGDYILKIISTNGDGKWSNTPTEIDIHIIPPFWETTLFKLFVIILFLGLFFVIMRIRTHNLQKQKIKLESEVSDRTKRLIEANETLEDKQEEILRQSDEIVIQRDSLKEQNQILEQQKIQIKDISTKLHESDQTKLKFFTNISHEFRTPLTLIMAPTEKLLGQENYNNVAKTKQDLSLIFRNVNRLFKLINQLLEIRKIETGNLKLSVQQNDIVSFINSIFQLFIPLSEKNGIDFQFKSKSKIKSTLFDMDIIEKVTANLLSNAFKYTPKNNKITLSIEECRNADSNPMLKISVKDSGVGISKDYLPSIFDRFSTDSKAKETGKISSGIGLSLSKDLIEAHHGDIKAFSETNVGTTIEVQIPLTADAYGNNEIKKTSILDNILEDTKLLVNIPDYSSNDKNANKDNNSDNDTFKILIVEDNTDLRNFLHNELSAKYNTLVAKNGMEGLAIAREYTPDLIVSDVMMPEMDGLTLCKEIKMGKLTSHIPVFLLTAKSDPEHQLSGFEMGADDYIVKPFSIDVLLYKIQNILNNRKELADKFTNDLNYIPENIKINQIDQGFLEKFVKYVEDNIDDSDLSGDIIASHMGMCKGNLYKKLKTINGMSVNIYVRTIRLKVAAKLLKSGEYNISDVAYSVGFNNPKYFSTCFSDLFSMSPKEYMNK